MSDEAHEELGHLRHRAFGEVSARHVVALPPRGHARLLDAITPVGRFDRFALRVAALADVSEAQAKAWLDVVWTSGDWEHAAPGAMAWWVPGGPKAANALRGFVRVAAGAGLAHHAHIGDEHILVIQGRIAVSTGELLRAGDTVTSPAGSAHAFQVPTGGTDLLLFTVAYRGIDFGSFIAHPRD